MKQFFTNSILLQSIVFALLIGQIWTSASAECNWLIDTETDLIELCSSPETDSEDENKTKKEAKVKFDPTALKSVVSTSSLRLFQLEHKRIVHCMEIPTPPPELIS